MCLVQNVQQCCDVNQLLLFITALQQTGEGAKFGFEFSSLKTIVWLVTV